MVWGRVRTAPFAPREARTWRQEEQGLRSVRGRGLALDETHAGADKDREPGSGEDSVHTGRDPSSHWPSDLRNGPLKGDSAPSVLERLAGLSGPTEVGFPPN